MPFRRVESFADFGSSFRWIGAPPRTSFGSESKKTLYSLHRSQPQSHSGMMCTSINDDLLLSANQYCRSRVTDEIKPPILVPLVTAQRLLSPL
mmetsp:Transcript_12508/g.22697  ORF Transcript_12508/g.22697 Transcript_12508/m.22697 type:complete len:93 (+) Transcript_12508:1355-1633(+)